MIIQSDTRDVPNFMMKQMVSVRLTDKKYSTNDQPISSLVASSNIFGLVFVGTPEKLLAIKVADVAEKDASSSKKITIDVDKFPHKEAWLPSSPSFVCLSSDHLTLLVCVTKSRCPVGWFYDVRGFARQDGGWSPFQEVRLSSCDGVTVQDCAWNPTMPNLLAVCLSDGSLVTVEINNTQITINSLPPITGAQAISWSPKGKQLVVARPGMLTQYKPDLKEAKTIPFSGSDIEMSKPMVCGLQWISTVQFLVVFVDQNSEQLIPHLFIVNLHKSGPPTFTCFYDICFTDPSSKRPNRYITLTIPTWNVILACASNATEVGVMGPPIASESSEHSEWIQWTLDDSARAEMPLDGSDSEPKPLGMTVDTSSQVAIPWQENQTLPPMPILFVLSSSGVLHPFYVINLLNGIPPQLNQPPQLLSSSNERPALANLRPSTASTVPLAASTPLPASGKAAIPRTNLGDRFAAVGAAASVNTAATNVPALNNSGIDVKSIITSEKVATSFFTKSPTVSNQLAPAATPTTTTFRVKPETSGANFNPSVPNLTGEMKITADDPNVMGAAAAILRDELTKFAQDLHDFKSRSASLKVHVASEEEKQRLISMTSELSDFSKELVVTTKNQDDEVHSLYTEVAEISALLEEARVRHARRKNPRYSQLLKTRPLDPSNRRKLDCIERLHIHIEQQLEEATRSLESNSRDRNKDRQRKVEIPVTRVIYEAIRSNSKVIMQLKTRLERIKVQINDQQLRLAGAALDVLRSKNTNESHQWDSDLAVLADSLLTTRIKDGDEKNVKSIHAVVPQVSPEKQAMLRHVLTQRPVARIRAVRPETASESRLLSNLSSLLHNSKQMEDKKTSSAETSSIRSKSTLLTSSNTIATGIQPQKTEMTSTIVPRATLEKANSKIIPTGLQTSVGSFSSFSAIPTTSSTVSNTAKNLASKVEDVTPPSSPLNFDQKAKAISGQHMISSLSLIPPAKSTVESEPKTITSNKPVSNMPLKLSTPESSSSFGPISVSKPTGSAFANAEVPAVTNTNLMTPTLSTAIGNSMATTTISSAEAAKIKSIFSSASTTSFNPPPVVVAPSSMSKQSSSTSLFGLGNPPPYSSAANVSGPTSAASTSEKSNLIATSQLPKTSFSFMSPSSSAAPPVIIPASSTSLVTKLAKESNPLMTPTTTLPSTTIPPSTFSFALPQSPSTVSEPPKIVDKATTGASNFSFNLNNTSSMSTTKPAASFSFSLPGASTNSPNISIGSAVTSSSAFSVNPASSTVGSSVFPLNTSAGKAQTPSLFGVVTPTGPPAISTLTTVTTTSSLLAGGSLFGQSTTTPLATVAPTVAPTVASSPFAQVAPNTQVTSPGQSNLSTSSSSNVSSTVPPLFGNATNIVSSQIPNSSSAISSTSNSLFGNKTPGLPASTATPLFGQSTPSAGAPSTSSSFAPLFGQSSFGSTTSGQNPPASSTSVFGQSAFGAPSSVAPPSTVSLAAPLFGSSTFGRPTSGFMTGSNAFGQPVDSSSSTTASPAQSLFGGSGFGSGQTAASGTSNVGNSSLGLASNAFGSMGLGSMSSATAATPNRNVFGGGAVFGSQAAPASGFGSPTPAFGNQGSAPVSSFGSPPTSGFGSMGGGLGSPAQFGGAATFGGSPLFGGKPTFGSPVSNNTISQPKAEPTGFVAFAAASNAPSFGALAGGGNNQPVFGGVGNNQPAFGGAAAFPQNNTPSFGGGSSFSSWR